MLKHILVPLDGSDLAKAAVKPALQLLEPNGKVTLLMALDVPQDWYYGVNPVLDVREAHSIAEHLKPQAKAYLDKIASDLRQDHFQVDTTVKFGNAATVIVETAEGRNVDVIAMSTHGRSGFSRWLFGSVTNKVLGLASCPVFVIPDRPQTVKPENTDAHTAVQKTPVS